MKVVSYGVLAIGLAAAVVLPAAPRSSGSQRVVRVHYTARDQQQVRYEYVPVDVPAGTTQLVVSYTYDRADGANAVDLGVYEPGPLTLGTTTLRGWTGGSVDTVTIGVDEASPGYWPGPLPAGRWHVMLGLYKVAPEGVDVTVSVHLSSEPAGSTTAVVPPHRTPPRRSGPAWYAGVLHAHTTNSDGALTPAELVEKARNEKLDFLAITDHNNTVHQLSVGSTPDLLVITGEEVTTPGGHFNVWGLDGARDYIDFRVAPGDAALAALMDSVRRRGGIVGINHPIADCVACTWTHDVPAAVGAIEVANGTPAARAQALVMWDTLLRSGRRLTAVGGSDFHQGPRSLGTPAVRVWAADLSTASILDGIRNGRAIVVANAGLPAPELVLDHEGTAARVGDTLVIRRGDAVRVRVHAPMPAYAGAHADLVWSGEVVASSPLSDDGDTVFDRYPIASGYARVHLASAAATPLAITNPVFVSVR